MAPDAIRVARFGIARHRLTSALLSGIVAAHRLGGTAAIKGGARKLGQGHEPFPRPLGAVERLS